MNVSLSRNHPFLLLFLLRYKRNKQTEPARHPQTYRFFLKNRFVIRLYIGFNLLKFNIAQTLSYAIKRCSSIHWSLHKIHQLDALSFIQPVRVSGIASLHSEFPITDKSVMNVLYRYLGISGYFLWREEGWRVKHENPWKALMYFARLPSGSVCSFAPPWAGYVSCPTTLRPPRTPIPWNRSSNYICSECKKNIYSLKKIEKRRKA